MNQQLRDALEGAVSLIDMDKAPDWFVIMARSALASMEAQPEPVGETSHGIAHSLAGFQGGFMSEHRRMPSSQEIWNHAIRSWRDLNPVTPKPARTPASEREALIDDLMQAHEGHGVANPSAFKAAADMLAADAQTVVKPGFGIDAGKLEKLRTNGLKPEEIAGASDKQHARVTELVHWFARLADGHANPKWLHGHAFELAYYLATEGKDRHLNLGGLIEEAWARGVNINPSERDMLQRHIPERFPAPPAPPKDIHHDHETNRMRAARLPAK